MQFRNSCRNMVLAGACLIWLIKLFIRPILLPGGAAGFLFGTAPNLVGSFLIPFGAHWLFTHANFFNGRLLRFSLFSDVRLVCLSGFLLLLLNEYLQLIPVFGRTFDYFDIVFSAVGLMASYYSFALLQRRYVKMNDLQ